MAKCYYASAKGSLRSCTKTVVQHAGDYIVMLFQSYCTCLSQGMVCNLNFAVWDTLEGGMIFSCKIQRDTKPDSVNLTFGISETRVV